MSEVLNVGVGSIDANPFRLTGDYPFVEQKIKTLMRSFKDVGMWEGVIARKAGNRHQIAFGHHRIEAARRLKYVTVPVVARELTDEQMLQFMGRENMEDYNADFLCMLETWEAGVKFRAADRTTTKAIGIARLLGWTVIDRGNEALSMTARACSAAHSLILGGYIKHDDLHDLSVKSAREIVERAQSRIDQLDRMAKQTKRSVQETETAKRQVGKAAATTAKQFVKGEHGLGQIDLRGRVDTNAYQFAKESKKQTPLFAVFVNAAFASVESMLKNDATAEKLREIVKVAEDVVTYDDKAALDKISFALNQLSDRSLNWQKKVTTRSAKIVQLKAIEGRKA